jgi:hypothetical protein
VQSIRSSSANSDENNKPTPSDEERLAVALADPEIQTILKDPKVLRVLGELQANPDGVDTNIDDPFISKSINKLIEAGILLLG